MGLPERGIPPPDNGNAEADLDRFMDFLDILWDVICVEMRNLVRK